MTGLGGLGPEPFPTSVGWLVIGPFPLFGGLGLQPFSGMGFLPG